MDRSDEENLTNLEKIALFSIYHKSNAPLTKYEGMKKIAKGSYIPPDYFTKSDVLKGELISLEDILDKRIKNTKKSDASNNRELFLRLVALFRFIDGMDIHKTRVGEYSERDLKTTVIIQDYEYFITKLDNVVQGIIDKVAKEDTALALEIYNQLFRITKEQIEKQTFKLDKKYKDFLHEKLGNLDEYWMILHYASFISVQEGHFDLHSCVDDIEVVCNRTDNDSLEIKYYLNQDIEWLRENTVREMRVGKMSILEKLFGNSKNKNLPYPLKELQEGASYLDGFLNLKKKGINFSLNLPKGSIKDEKELEKYGELEDCKEKPSVVNDRITVRKKFILDKGKLVPQKQDNK